MVSDTQEHDRTMVVPARSTGTGAPDAGSPAHSAAGPSLDSVDFDVTAGFPGEAPVEPDAFIDITRGADEISPPRAPQPAAAESPPASSRRALVAVLAVLAVLAAAAVAWWMTR